MALIPHRMPNGRLNKKQATAAAKVLDEIVAEKGHVKPSYVIDAARPAHSPIHSLFTWDNTKAAEKWREEEARSLIRSIRVVRDDVSIRSQPVIRRYMSVTAVDGEAAFEGDAYLSADQIANDDDYREQTLHVALQDLQAWQTKYDGLKEFFGVYSEIASIGRTLSARSKVKKQHRKAA